jgi:hypothetical protein
MAKVAKLKVAKEKSSANIRLYDVPISLSYYVIMSWHSTSSDPDPSYGKNHNGHGD